MSDYILLSDFAKTNGMDRSHARKYALKHGIEFVRIRTPETQNQLALALTQEDAELLRSLREQQGFNTEEVTNVAIAAGWFYVVQVVPDLDPSRIKLGFSTDPTSRLAAYHTIVPTAVLVQTWPCRASWEKTAIDSVTRIGCQSLGVEVFVCDSLEQLLERCNAFFAILSNDI